MGMECYGRQVSEFKLQQMLRTPKVFYQWLLDIDTEEDRSADVMSFMQAVGSGNAVSLNEDQKRKMVPYLFRQWMKMMGSAQGEDYVIKMLESQIPDARKYIDNSEEAQEERRQTSAETLNLHKDWHILHFLLCGSPEPTEEALGQCILGGREVPDELGVMGYGPARYFTANEVGQISVALNDVTPDDLESMWNPSVMDMAGVYGTHGNVEFDADTVMEYFKRLCDFYADAASKSNSVVMYLT